MLTVVQRVISAEVRVDGHSVAKIEQGLLILCGFQAEDTRLTNIAMLEKCINYRIFNDLHGKMNLSLKQINGSLLLVPQFTLLKQKPKKDYDLALAKQQNLN